MGRWGHQRLGVLGFLPCRCLRGEWVKGGVGKDQGSACILCLMWWWASPSSSPLVPVVLTGQVPKGLAHFLQQRFEIWF